VPKTPGGSARKKKVKAKRHKLCCTTISHSVKTHMPTANTGFTTKNYEVDYFRNFEKLWPRAKPQAICVHGLWTQYASTSISKEKLEKANIFDRRDKIFLRVPST
jgi:hypothetical protein